MASCLTHLYRSVNILLMSASKKELLVSGALKLFYSNGFHATGMDLIAAEVGISKTSIYKHFRTKEELIEAVLELRCEQFRDWFTSYVESRASTPKEQLLMMFDALNDWFSQEDFKGCMFIKAASEYQDAKDPIHKFAAQHKRLIKSFILKKVNWMGAKNPEELTEGLNFLIEGSIVVAKMNGAKGVSNSAKNAAKILIKDSMN